MSPGLIPENNKAAEPSAASGEWTEPAGTRDAWSLLAGCGLSRLFIRGVVGPALPGFVLCSLYSQLTTCHGNWNLSQVLGRLELLNQTVIIEFHAHRNYDKWRRPVLVFLKPLQNQNEPGASKTLDLRWNLHTPPTLTSNHLPQYFMSKKNAPWD